LEISPLQPEEEFQLKGLVGLESCPKKLGIVKRDWLITDAVGA
jgi:hypothetical protein